MSETRVRLLKRIAECDRYYEGSESSDEMVLTSVKEHLELLLNSRQGDSPASPDYGLPDLTGIIAGLPKSERLFRDAVEATIRAHEPRIRWVRVRLDDGNQQGSMNLGFFVEFSLVQGSDQEKRRMGGSVNIDSVFTIER